MIMILFVLDRPARLRIMDKVETNGTVREVAQADEKKPSVPTNL